MIIFLHLLQVVGGSNDDLEGGEGEDSLYGGNGEDTLKGGSGNDTIEGQEGSDTIFGGSGNDLLFGDRIDRIAGGSTDSIFGEEGNDSLIGGVENDILDGGDGEDTLLGVDPSANDELGENTIDTLSGGSGEDIFVLGRNDSVFYNDGIPGNLEDDFALITDYEIDTDKLELSGSLEDYSLGASPVESSGLGIFLGQEENELIAVLEGVPENSVEDISQLV